MNRFRHTVSVLSLVMVLLLLAGCLPKAGVTEYTLTVNVKPEGAAEVKGVAEKYEKNTIVTFKLIANEGYEFVEWEDDVKPTQISDGQWLIIMDGDKTLTAVFEEIEEEDIEELIAAAEAAIKALPEPITLEDADKVAEARALVNAVLARAEDAQIAGIGKLEAAEEGLQFLLWLQVNEDLVADALKKVNKGLDLKAPFKDKELVLPEELTVGADDYVVISYVLIWTTDSPDVVKIEEEEEEGLKAKITRPEETTTVTLTATLGYDISAQAETKPQSFDVQIKVWGLVPELKSFVDEGEDEEFKKLLVILVPDYDKNLVADIKDAIVADLKVAIADLEKLETKEELLQVIAAVTEENTVDAINKETDAKELAQIIWNLKVAEFINLAGEDAREEVARAVIMAPEGKPYKSTAEFKAAVVEVVATYLELIEAVETADDKAGLAEALTAAFEFIDKHDPVDSTMVDNVWEYKAREDFKGFKSIIEIWRVARGVAHSD